MATPIITDPKLVIPTKEDFEKLLTSKLSYEAKKGTPDEKSWGDANFNKTPWGIAYSVSQAYYKKCLAAYSNSRSKNKKTPVQKYDIALRYFIAAVAIDYKDLIDQLKRTLINWEFTSNDLKNIAKNVWQPAAQDIANICDSVVITDLIEQADKLTDAGTLTEAIEKHDTLNSKLFTKEEILKDKVRDKLLEIVDEFIADLKEQDIKIKVDDILLIGSNASYNYTKNSDIDLHILANAKAADYDTEIATALYGAYRTIFNKQLDITLYDIPLEINFYGIRDHRRYPDERFWEIAGRVGNRVVYGFDSHDTPAAFDGESIAVADELVRKYGLELVENPKIVKLD